ncbi:uncharacterized protein Dvar_76810 [Desulfosarcina variabilis str. Montpellier]
MTVPKKPQLLNKSIQSTFHILGFSFFIENLLILSFTCWSSCRASFFILEFRNKLQLHLMFV